MWDWLQALVFQVGFNTSLVTVGAILLGASAGMIGSFVLLRKRSLITDAISHSTLPGLGIAFIIMALVMGDGRWLPGLLIGAGLSAAFGLWGVNAISKRTRLGEDAAIGAVLSTLFGLGVVLITIIQSMPVSGQAGLTGYLIGSTAGMLASEAELIALSAVLLISAVLILRRDLLVVCFDPAFARSNGTSPDRVDAQILFLLLMVVVIGLKVTGLILIVALTIIPPVSGSFWTNRPFRMVALSAFLGALAGYLGVTLSSVREGLPTGPLVVLSSFVIFLVSFLFSPNRGILATLLSHRRFRERVHLRQGLLSLARNEAIYDDMTLKQLRRKKFVRRDGVPTPAGRSAARDAEHEERLWSLFRHYYPDDAGQFDNRGLLPIAQCLSPDTITALEQRSIELPEVNR